MQVYACEHTHVVHVHGANCILSMIRVVMYLNTEYNKYIFVYLFIAARSLPFLHAIPHSEQLFIEKYNTTSALRLGPSSLWRKRHEFLKSMIVSSAGREYPEYIYLNFISRAKRADPERVLFSSSLPLLGHAQGSILERRCASRKLSENDMAWLHIIFRYSRAFN